jgi:hypothetical protein
MTPCAVYSIVGKPAERLGRKDLALHDLRRTMAIFA